MKKTLFTIIVFLAGALILAVNMGIQIRKDRDRLEGNQASLLQKANYYRTKDSLSAASVQKLTLTTRELKQGNDRLATEIENLNIKLRRVQAASTNATKTEVIIKTQIKDSLIIVDGKPDTLKCIEYRNPWLTLHGCIQAEQFNGRIESRDTLVQVIHRIPRRFLFIRYGTKSIRQEVVSKNPHTRITYAEYIELKK